MSQIDTFDLKPDWAQQGPVEAIASSADGILVSHQLPNLARHMDKIAVIRSMQSHQGAHVPGQYFLHTSYEEREDTAPGAGGVVIAHVRGDKVHLTRQYADRRQF